MIQHNSSNSTLSSSIIVTIILHVNKSLLQKSFGGKRITYEAYCPWTKDRLVSNVARAFFFTFSPHDMIIVYSKIFSNLRQMFRCTAAEGED